MFNHRDDHRDGEFEGRTYLYIRTHPADNGTEPLAAGLPFWISPDITIIQPGGIRTTEANVGQPSQVEVIVTNAGGIQANDAYVEAFVADPSTVITPATASPVGSGFVTVPGYSTAAIAFPWTPKATDAGHRCLVARVCLTIPPDCYADPTIFDVAGDRHVAQRNISVITMEQGMEMLSFGFMMNNPFPTTAEFQIRAREVLPTGENAALIRAALGCRFVQFGATPLNAVRLDFGDNDCERPKVVGLFRRDAFSMEPMESRHAVVNIGRNPETRPGDVHVVEIVQTSLRTRQIVGGLWLIVQH